jgi:hypothetical protein
MKITLSLTVASMLFAGAVNAASISGTIKISAFLSSPSVDYSANKVSFGGSPNAIVTGVDGSYSGVVAPATFVQYSDFTYDPFAPVNPLWITLAGPNASFSLTSITFIDEDPGNSLVLKGYGTASLAGFSDTLGSWSFSADQQGTDFNWSSMTKAPAEVPDGGSTLALLGLSVLGLGGARRLLSSSRK